VSHVDAYTASTGRITYVLRNESVLRPSLGSRASSRPSPRRAMRIVAGIAFALISLVWQGCSAGSSTAPPVQCAVGQHPIGTSCAWDPVFVAIGPGVTSDGCPVFSPTPASLHTNQVVEWTNNSTTTRTVYQFMGWNNGVPPTPLATVAPGQTSGGVFWSSAGSVSVYLSGCPSNTADWGSLVITVN
jgi:hypothetical protein